MAKKWRRTVLKSTENNRHKCTSIMFCWTRKINDFACQINFSEPNEIFQQKRLYFGECVYVDMVRLHHFNAPIKSQWHKPTNWLGVQLKFCIFMYVEKMFWLLCWTFYDVCFAYFHMLSFFFGTTTSHNINLRTFASRLNLNTIFFSLSTSLSFFAFIF